MTSGPFFGELYLRSTRPFLSDLVTGAEGQYLAQQLRVLSPDGPFVDLGAGHGRHLARLQHFGLQAVGLDFDHPSLCEARAFGPPVQGSFLGLPFRDASVGAMYSWYNSLFTFDDDALKAILGQIHRALRPGGGLILQGMTKAKAEGQPVGRWDGDLPDGCHLAEDFRWNASLSRDEISRVLTLPDGRRLQASFFIRYFTPEELESVLERAGFSVLWVHGDLDGNPPGEALTDLIIGATKRD